MRSVFGSAFAAAAVLCVAGSVATAQNEQTRSVAGGGVTVQGWTGKVDATEAAKGLALKDAKFAKEGDAFHVVTGPQGGYWSSTAKASGNYTVKATFTEPKFQNMNDHPHPYGLFIAGSDMEANQPTYLYCAAYGKGSFIVRGFGPASFKLNGGGEANPAVNKAAGVGQPVTQEIAMSVKGDKVECAINGKVVGTYDKSALVGEGKLKSLDGVYGLRFGHNTEVMVSGLTMTKN